jgi:hypothetical protein
MIDVKDWRRTGLALWQASIKKTVATHGHSTHGQRKTVKQAEDFTSGD